ncbi:glucose 1-dehydrogenase [Sinimarinibacterium thermocellulolyticum]|jgi:3(or 17)beta-hydroxysteroid dehydrogenase|uniref:Glucose 1-dehydrogenase n=1 Tax=Sinimarinibacterium thermocellulolyticum TaxID=3170016 RepID=A0ABV2A8R7_9GAMM
MTKRLEGKVALITGGALGIGLKTAERFAEEGAAVAIADILVEQGRQAAEALGGDATFIELDVTNEAGWQAAIQTLKAKHGRLDVLVNNAGISPFGTIQDTTYELWKKVMAVNADSVFLGCKSAMGLMRKTGGAIINLSSMMGIRSDANLAAYSASKGAVRLLTKSVALHGAPYKIRCNSVHPGGVQTRMLDDFLGVLPDKDAAMKMVTQQVPLGRVGQPEDIANAILYLASDEASWVTGIELCVDGGSLLL